MYVVIVGRLELVRGVAMSPDDGSQAEACIPRPVWRIKQDLRQGRENRGDGKRFYFQGESISEGIESEVFTLHKEPVA